MYLHQICWNCVPSLNGRTCLWSREEDGLRNGYQYSFRRKIANLFEVAFKDLGIYSA